jgi:PAS domain S-box-containing protein
MNTAISDLLIAMLFVSGISMAAIGLYARRFIGRVPAATPFILLMFMAMAWSILYALDLLGPTLPLKVLYHNLRFLVLPFFAIVEVWLVIAYVNKTEWLRRDWAALALIIPSCGTFLALTSPYHTLFRYNFALDLTGPVPVLHYSEGIGFSIYNIYSFILLVLAIVLLISESRKKGTLREMPTILLLTALAFPTAFNYLFLIYPMGFTGINPTPAFLWIPAGLYAIALFRYRFLDIIPIARSRLIEALSKPVLVQDIDGRIIDINPAACTLFSTAPATALGKTVEEITPDWPDLITLCNERAREKRNLSRTRPDGTHYYIGTVEPLLSSGGVIEGHLIFLQDVTELKITEAALRQSEENYRVLVESSFDGIGIHQDGNVVYMNTTGARLLGCKDPGLFIGRPVISLVAPAFRELAVQRISHAANTPLPLVREQFIREDGIIIDVDVTTVPSTWNGRPAAYVTFRDITAQVQAENALRESEEKYRTIIEEMQDLFYRTDLKGKITMLSPSAFAISGYTREELIGQDVAKVYADPQDREKFLTILQQKGSVDSFPVKLKAREGAIRYVTTSSHFYRNAQGKIAGVEGVIHDITEQRRAEEALRMANKKLNLLSSITRHDIRNQLMALMAFLELSVESINKPEELEEFLKKNQQIAITISDQITFTKDYEDLGVKAPSWQDVKNVVEKAMSGLPLRTIRLENETEGLWIFADPLVEKVFYNLIDNVLRYGGAKTTRIHISSHPQDGNLIIVFEDDGAGIPGRDKAVIFDRGFGKNTGLGLYLSREILGITGITIAETGVFGTGARFEMTIPAGEFRFTKPGA